MYITQAWICFASLYVKKPTGCIRLALSLCKESVKGRMPYKVEENVILVVKLCWNPTNAIYFYK